MNDKSSSQPNATVCMDVIETLRELADEDTPDFLKDLIDSFLDDAPERLEAIRAGIQANDLATVLQASHALKSSSANLGALQLSNLCGVIEAQARRGNIASLEEKRIEAQAEFQNVRREMTSLPDCI